MSGSWMHFLPSNRRIRSPRKLWIQRSWKLDLSSLLFNLTWKIKLCKLAPVWLVTSSSLLANVVAWTDHYCIIINIVVIYMFGIQNWVNFWKKNSNYVLTLNFEKSSLDWKWYCRYSINIFVFRLLYYGLGNINR